MTWKTISCKLKEGTFNDLTDMCENSGITTSEWVRNMIEDEFERLDEEEKEPQKITISEIPKEEQKPRVVTHGKILDDYGNVIGTF